MAVQPPLFPRTVFVDWHGVLSRDRIWSSIRDSHRHPLRGLLEQRVSAVLAHGILSTQWMTGRLSTADIVGPVVTAAPERYGRDFLLRRVEEDCARMHVDEELIGALQTLRTQATVVVATDNMDCFAATFRGHSAAHPPRHVATSTLARHAALFDDLICSSDVGSLKARDPLGFFGGWLRVAGLTFVDSVLIDDRADNCEAFRRCGGRAVQWRMGDGTDDLVAEISAWASAS